MRKAASLPSRGAWIETMKALRYSIVLESRPTWKRHSERIPIKEPSIHIKGTGKLVPFMSIATLFGYQQGIR